MAWLAGWKKRRAVTVSNTDIDSPLTHFPLLLALGSSVGTGGDDNTSIFDELGSDANRLKIAVTEDDGVTEIKVEIEKWDHASEAAYLWVASSGLTLSSTGTTTLYLYYDASQPDNTANVGDTNDVAAEGVWDAGFKAVHHMADGASSSATYDSTSNDTDGTKGTAGEPTEVAGHIGDGQDFDGNDILGLGDTTILDGATAYTIEAWVNFTTLGVDDVIARKWAAGQQAYFFGIDNAQSDELQMAARDGAAILNTRTTDVNLVTGTLYHLVAVWSGGNNRVIYVNATTPTLSDVMADGPTNIDNVSEVLSFGARDNNGSPDFFLDGLMDEARISDTARSAAWVKATYHSGNDNLVSWGDEESRRVMVVS